MEIILLEDIEKLGFKNEVVRVKDGYGMNFLLPQGKALLATESAKKHLTEILKQKERKEQKIRQEKLELAEKIKALTLKLSVKTGEKGKLFGAVGNAQLAELITQLGVAIDKKDIALRGSAIKKLGKYVAEIRLHRDVRFEVAFEVVAAA